MHSPESGRLEEKDEKVEVGGKDRVPALGEH